MMLTLATTIYGIVFSAYNDLYHVIRLESYMTLWGVWICTAYFVFIHEASKKDKNSKLWKLVYILGELGFAFEFLIVPFFWGILFPYIFGKETWAFFIFNCLSHGVTGICIFVEYYITPFKFPSSHRIILIIVGVVYLINNFLWTKISGEYVYIVITWESWWTLFFVVVSFVLALVGFEVGRWHYPKKKLHMEKTERLTDSSEYN